MTTLRNDRISPRKIWKCILGATTECLEETGWEVRRMDVGTRCSCNIAFIKFAEMHGEFILSRKLSAPTHGPI